MKEFVNETRIEGYLYDHKLEKKLSGPTSKNPGTEYITGTVSIATTDDKLNVVDVHFTYVTATTKAGNPNRTFAMLTKIIDGVVPTVMGAGPTNAAMVQVSKSNLDVNEWFDSNDGSLISRRRNEGGFIQTVSSLRSNDERATFDTDIIMKSFIRAEADPERALPERGRIKGSILYRGMLKPVEYVVYIPAAIDYFESLAPSENKPVAIHVKGQQISQTVIRKIEETTGWGEVKIREVPSSQREFVVDWAGEPYTWDSAETILGSELADLITKREAYLAEIKANQEARAKAKAQAGNIIAAAAPAASTPVYKF